MIVFSGRLGSAVPRGPSVGDKSAGQPEPAAVFNPATRAVKLTVAKLSCSAYNVLGRISSGVGCVGIRGVRSLTFVIEPRAWIVTDAADCDRGRTR